MDAAIHQNNSQAELVRAEDGAETEPIERNIKDIAPKEWIVVLILCFVNLINYMDRFTVAGMLTDIQDHFDIKNDKGGLLQTAFVLSYMLFAPLFGYLGDRYSRRIIMSAGVFLWSLTTLLGSFMDQYWYFLLFRAMVGIGEASYSTIAPTIISDLFVGNIRSKMLALFYFAIPVGSGLGYIVGSETAKALGSWKWGLRVTPILGAIAVLLLIFVLKDPERGQSEATGHLEATPWTEDIKDIVRNRSFMFSTAGFTCVTFVAGALSWWGPKFIIKGLKLQGGGPVDENSSSLIFGAITMLAGIVGLTLGCFISQRLRMKCSRVDPIVCGAGLIISAPFLVGAMFATTFNTALCYVLLFLGEVALNLNWAIVSDILLYVVMPMRRSTAEGFQLLFSHALGDAGSPYLIGVLSEAFQLALSNSNTDPDVVDFRALQYALLLTCFVEVLGSLFFFINAFYIVDDKHKVEKAVHGNSQHLLTNPVEVEQSIAS